MLIVQECFKSHYLSNFGSCQKAQGPRRVWVLSTYMQFTHYQWEGVQCRAIPSLSPIITTICMDSEGTAHLFWGHVVVVKHAEAAWGTIHIYKQPSCLCIACYNIIIADYILSTAPSCLSSFKRPVSRKQEPMLAYSLMRNFLLLWKRLQVFKYNWGKLRLGVEEINTPALYRTFW